MLTKDIAIKASTFRREGFKRFSEVSMSRRYIKNALFLALFACLTIAVYTVFLNVKSGAKRSGSGEFVQNMFVDVPNGHRDDTYKQVDENIDSHNDNLDGNGRNLEGDLPQAFDLGRIPNWPAEVKEEKIEAEQYQDKQNEGVESEDNKGDAFIHDEIEIPLNDAIDSENDEDDDGGVEAYNGEGGGDVIPQIDPEQVRVRDEEGNIVGYKLFPHGLHPDMNKPPEQIERELRKRLGLPPKGFQKPKEKVPEITNEPRRPGVLPRQKIINVGEIHREPDETEEGIDDLGAFHLKDRVPNKVNAFLRQDNFNDGLNDGFEDGDVEDEGENNRRRPDDQIHLDGDENNQFDDLLEDRFADEEKNQLPRLGDKVQPANQGQIFPPRDSFNAYNRAYPDRFAQENYRKNNANGIVNPNRYGNANNGAIIRPIGNNGMNPFHSGELEGREGRDNIMPNRIPDRRDMAPFANNQGMPDNQMQNAPLNNNRMAPFPLNQAAIPNGRGMDPFANNQEVPDSQMQNAPMNNNRMAPFHLNEGAVPNDRGMDPFAQQNGDIRQDVFQNDHINNRRIDNAFGRNPERMNDAVPADSRGRNRFAHQNEGVAENLLDNPRNREGNPFAPKALSNREGGMLHEPMVDGREAGLESALGGHDSLVDGNPDEDEQIGEKNPNRYTSEGKPSGVLNQMPQEKDEPESPLDIKDINKPLPVKFDCIPFLFPPKKGALCVHEPDHDKALSGVIKTTGIWEPAMLAGFFAILKANPELNVVDIGAGIGVYTLTAAMMGRKVVAVEPLYLNYRMLHKSALENEVSDKITLVAQAIGSESYLGHLNYSDETGGYSQTHIDRILEDQANADSPDVVQVTTLNNLAHALPFDSAVMKIDVGGFMEPEVLTSSSKFFKALRVPYILTHWNFHTGVMKKILIVTLLTQKGYRPRTEWNGGDTDPDVLQQDLDYLIWAL